MKKYRRWFLKRMFRLWRAVMQWQTHDGNVLAAATAYYAVLSLMPLLLILVSILGFIFQFYNLVPTLSAAENIALPLLIDGQRVDAHEGKIKSLLEMVGLGDRSDHKPDQMSGGQQQRVAIARAFVNDPEIVLADEPTGNLDSKSGTAILELLRHSCDQLQQTIVMVTHDPRAASYADRVVFLKDGRIINNMAVAEKRGADKDILRIMNVMRELEL